MWSSARKEIAESSESSSIYIGCDSLLLPNKMASYCIVIILHRNSNHGCRVFHNTKKLPEYGNMRARLLMEVQLALEAFYEIEDVIGSRNLEIHLDINPNPRYNSHVAIAEALGWVRSLGLTAKVKPEAFAASACADHFVRRPCSSAG